MSQNRAIHFLKVEIKETKNRIDSKNYVSAHNGVEVGNESAKKLNELHILFCERLIYMIENEENE